MFSQAHSFQKQSKLSLDSESKENQIYTQMDFKASKGTESSQRGAFLASQATEEREEVVQTQNSFGLNLNVEELSTFRPNLRQALSTQGLSQLSTQVSFLKPAQKNKMNKALEVCPEEAGEATAEPSLTESEILKLLR